MQQTGCSLSQHRSKCIFFFILTIFSRAVSLLLLFCLYLFYWLIQVWKNAFVEKQQRPYMEHVIPGSTVHSLQFCPYEDVLGVGHATGYTSLLIPGRKQAL